MRIRALFLGLVLSALGVAQAPKLQTWEKVISPGLVYRMEVDSETPVIVHALRYTPGTPGLKAFPELAGHTINEEGTVKGRLTPTQMVAQESAIAAINGDFFSFNQGAPIGTTIREGELLDTALKSRAVFGWGPKQSSIGFCTTTTTVMPDGGTAVKMTGINQPCGVNEAVLYTPAEGTATSPAPNVTAIINLSNATWAPNTVVTGTMEYMLPDAKVTKVPDGKAMIVATGDRIQQITAIKPGSQVTIKIQTTGLDWEKVENVISGGPILLKDGKEAIDAEAEGLGAAFSTKRHPRTAIGRTSEGDIWLVAVDGRQEISVGASLPEMAKIMLRLGCVDAINLDGGGSTCLHLRGVTVNRPSDGVERPVSNAVMVFGPKLVAYNGDLKIAGGPKIPLTGNTDITLTLDGVPVPNADVIWGAQGAAWIDQGGTLHPLELGKVRVRVSAYGKTLTAEISVVEKLGRAKGVGRLPAKSKR